MDMLMLCAFPQQIFLFPYSKLLLLSLLIVIACAWRVLCLAIASITIDCCTFFTSLFIYRNAPKKM